MAAPVGGSATTSTGHVKMHATRAGAPRSRSAGSTGPVGGSATVSTSRVALSATKAGPSRSRGVGSVGPVGGSKTTSTGRVAQHVGRPAGAPGARGGGS